jgi:hypothetical protein
MSSFLTCQQLRELFPQYDNLTEEKVAQVEEHLEGCDQCREFCLPDEEEHLTVLKKSAPTQLDQAIMAELSVARKKRIMTIVATALAANIITSLLIWVPAHLRSRENMAFHMNNFAQGLTLMNNTLVSKQEIPGFLFEVTAGAILTEASRWELMLSRSKNMPSSRRSGLQFNDQAPVMDLYRYLILRNRLGFLSPEELQLKDEFREGLHQLETFLERQQERLTASSPFLRLIPVPIHQIEQKIKDLNYLSSFYLRYSALPGSLEQLDSSIFLARTKDILSLDEDYELLVISGAKSLQELFHGSSFMHLELSTIQVRRDNSIIAEITFDNFNGKVLSISYRTSELLIEEDIISLAGELFARAYPAGYSLNISAETFPRYTNLQANLYFGGIRVSAGSISGHYRNDSRELYLYFGHLPVLDGVQTTAFITHEQALTKLNPSSPDALVYDGLIMIPSAASNNYILAHRFLAGSIPYYVNANSGVLETDIRFFIRNLH